jgi:hypothetical protein
MPKKLMPVATSDKKLGVKVYKRLENLSKYGVDNNAMRSLKKNIETFQLKNGIESTSKWGTTFQKNMTSKQRSQLRAILKQFLGTEGSSVAEIKKDYEQMTRDLAKLDKVYKTKADVSTMAKRLDKRDVIAQDAQIAKIKQSEVVAHMYEMQKQYGWDTATSRSMLLDIKDQLDSGAYDTDMAIQLVDRTVEEFITGRKGVVVRGEMYDAFMGGFNRF